MATYKSELRGIFIHEAIFGVSHDWNVIAQTCTQYGVNTVVINDQSGVGRRPDSDLSSAITAFHANGIEYHSCTGAIAETSPVPGDPYVAIKSDGSMYSRYVQCPIKIHDAYLANLQSYFTAHPDVDGYMFDYIRYEVIDMCYCPQCRAAFEQWLGEGPITNWTPFYDGGSRWLEYAEWRTIPITELVRDASSWIRAHYPNVKISEAAWTYFSDCPIYWRKFLGQDTGKWIKEDYLDFVAPMTYMTDLTELGLDCDYNLKYMTGGARGKIPLVAFLNNNVAINPERTPQKLKDEINLVRSKGLDGWIIWRYGGPGDSEPNPDIRNYLSIIDLPPVFTLENIQVFIAETFTTITWQTSLPATSKVEFSEPPLFTSEFEQWRGDMSSWNTKHHPGTIIEDSTPKTSHSISFPSITGKNYYFRASSSDVSGIATSSQMTTLEAPPPSEIVTPWTGELDAGTYRITMPQQVRAGSDLYNFKQWEDGSTNPVRTVNLVSDMAIRATYELLAPPPPGYHHLTIVAYNGTTNPTVGIYEIAEGTTVQVTATPNTGYLFKHWLLDNVIAGLDPTITVAMDADHTLLAICEAVSPTPLTSKLLFVAVPLAIIGGYILLKDRGR